MYERIYIGLMSGTSMDAMDGIAVLFGDSGQKILADCSLPWDTRQKECLHQLCIDGAHELEIYGQACNLVAKKEAEAVRSLLTKAGINAKQVSAIGSHGQTVRHRPEHGFSIQLDNGALLAALTGIDTVCNFRAADLAHHGQGAPLTPVFHQLMFANFGSPVWILNLGGIANLTCLDESGKLICGFDCGPGNTLIDLSCRMLLKKAYDKDGLIASSGKVNRLWLAKFLELPYLSQKPPKSTGRELFNADFIKDELLMCAFNNELIPDLLSTLAEYTVLCAVNALRACQYQHGLSGGTLILCGGGALNPVLVSRFEDKLRRDGIEVRISDEFGVSSSFLEAQSFAYFAKCCIEGIPLDLTSVTGADLPYIAGCICPATDGCYARKQRSSC